jgi:hypothetical protein
MQQQRLPFFCAVDRAGSAPPSSSCTACDSVLAPLQPLTHPDTVSTMLDLAPSLAANARWGETVLRLLEEAWPLHAAQLAESHTGTNLSIMDLSVALQVLPPPPPAASPRSSILLADTPRHVTSAPPCLQHCERRAQEAVDTMARAGQVLGQHQQELALVATTCLAVGQLLMHRPRHGGQAPPQQACVPPRAPTCAATEHSVTLTGSAPQVLYCSADAERCAR